MTRTKEKPMTANLDAHFTTEQLDLLTQWVSSLTEDVFCVYGPPHIVGAIFARYSRSPDGFRELFLKEFAKDGVVNAKRAHDLIERVLVAYGDDSVGELEGAHVSFERISILATKEIEDRRIGGSPIEKSTRYVFFDKRDDQGNFPYHRDKKIMASPAAGVYVEGMDFIFQTYCDLIPLMTAFYEKKRPMDDVRYKLRENVDAIAYADCSDDAERKKFRKTYSEDIRTKTCDALRCLLPLAIYANVGVFGNGRYYQHMLSHCYSQPLTEVRDMAAKAHTALDTVIPHYVKRAAANPYLIRVREGMRALEPTILAGTQPRPRADVALLDVEPDFLIDALRRSGQLHPEALRQAIRSEEDVLMMACMLYPYAALPLGQIRDIVRRLPHEMHKLIVSTYVGDRHSRRDRPGRAFEAGYPYTFDFATDFGTFKDLERHRMCTQLRQEFSPHLGFDMPQDVVEAGFADRVDACVAKARALHAVLVSSGFRDEAQYATLHGSTVRWVLGINDRALHHLLELRTQPQGHPSYRKVCQEMHRLVEKRRHWRGGVMQFVDYEDYDSARGDAEARQRQKEAKLGLTDDEKD